MSSDWDLESARGLTASLTIGLALWSVHAGLEGKTSTAKSLLHEIAFSFDGIIDTLSATVLALEKNIETDDWLEWVDLPRFGGTFSTSVNLELLRAALAMCLLLVAEGRQPGVPEGWSRTFCEDSDRLLVAFADSSWGWLLNQDRVSQDAETLRQTLLGAAEEERLAEIEQVRTATLRPENQRLLEEEVNSWDEYSIVRGSSQSVRNRGITTARSSNVQPPTRHLRSVQILFHGRRPVGFDRLSRQRDRQSNREEGSGVAGSSCGWCSPDRASRGYAHRATRDGHRATFLVDTACCRAHASQSTG